MPGFAYLVRMVVILAAAVVFLGTSFLPLAAITSEAGSWIGPGLIHSSFHHHSGFSEFVDGIFALLFCAGCLGAIVMISLLPVIFTVLIAIWMYNDAKRRGDSNAVAWALLGLIFNVIALVLYLIVRNSAQPATVSTSPVQPAPAQAPPVQPPPHEGPPPGDNPPAGP